MGDIARDPDLDHRPDPRKDVESVTGAASDAAESADGASVTPPEPSGAPDGAPGAAGQTSNRDKTAQ
ncbi:hypothetical protein [Sphingomonas sp. G-3-2-10]|uniref:hypothetical protein n=1 Tax=Sphingomonas sp. G-3-2-10 TaxID=2728838 RepID=UPI00146D9129|nr:hypothetical protein [Sphingomonas sp. G-3-2-10]NML04519.1 hypothetical protein [Sphingomonas sp. G-3-2-10]